MSAHHQQTLQLQSAPQELGLQQLLQLQSREQQVFSEQCLKQVAGLMAAATRGSSAAIYRAGWNSCFDTRRQPHHRGSHCSATAAHQKGSTGTAAAAGSTGAHGVHCVSHSMCRVDMAELLQVAVTASDASACHLLCNRLLSRYIS
jgi:hypothetical protein